MQKFMRLALLLLLFLVCGFQNAEKNYGLQEFLEKHNLTQQYNTRVEELKQSYNADKMETLLQNIEKNIKSGANEEYKLAYLQEFIEDGPLAYLYTTYEYINKLGVRYDPEYTMEYLENLPEPTTAQKLQLLVLWVIRRPQMVQSKKYKDLVYQVDSEIRDAIKNEKHWFAKWHADEYIQNVGDDVMFCYENLPCLFDAIPYWLGVSEKTEVYIPCEVAQMHDKVSYFDAANGGHGAQSFMTSDCDLYEQFSYDAELNRYLDMLFYENTPDGRGSSRFYYQARAVNDMFKNQYNPDFDIEWQENWTDLPYTEWAVQSYYNFKKFNEVLNFGIGYKKALEQLAEFYMNVHGADKDKAYNKALEVLNPPSSEYWQRIKSDNLQYLLLSGAEWEKIKPQIPEGQKYGELLEFSVAYPRNVEKIIEEGTPMDGFDIDSGNSFGKTPLMLAAQYGYLDTVKILLQNGADINKQTKWSNCADSNDNFCINNGERSALMYALQERQFETAKYLLEQGADTTLQDTLGKSAYDYMMGLAPQNAPVSMDITSGGAKFRDDVSQPTFGKKELEYLRKFIKPLPESEPQGKAWEGTWEYGRYGGAVGDLVIKDCYGKRCSFSLRTVNGSHTCSLEGFISVEGDVAHFVEKDLGNYYSSKWDGVVEFTWDAVKNIITVNGSSSHSWHCGLQGYYEGEYENEKNPLRFKTGFDCWSRNLSEAEKTICATEDLAMADLELETKFKEVKTAEWRKKREACGKNTDCLWELYVKSVYDAYRKTSGGNFSLYQYLRDMAGDKLYYPTDFVLLTDYLKKNIDEVHYREMKNTFMRIAVKEDKCEDCEYNEYSVAGLHAWHSSSFYLDKNDELWVVFTSANLEDGDDECFIVYAPQGKDESDIPNKMREWMGYIMQHVNKCIKVKHFGEFYEARKKLLKEKLKELLGG